MTRAIKRTAGVLLAFFAIQVVLILALLGWEAYAVSSPGEAALITTVIKIAWANQPWVILLVLLLSTAGLFFLFGHFFAGPKDELDSIRHRDWDAEEEKETDRQLAEKNKWSR